MKILLDRRPRQPIAVVPRRWTDALSASGSEAEVLKVARDFVSKWSGHEIVLLPDRCGELQFEDGADLRRLAVVLHEEQLTCDSLVEGLLVDRAAVFFSAAALRLAQLRAQ